MRRVPAQMRLAVAAVAAVAALALPGLARAGYGVQPAAGSTTGSKPTFLVYLDSADSLARVYVATSSSMTTAGVPVSQVGSCAPSTPWTEPGKFTCQPASYSTTGTGSLAPGTYYWWLTFSRRDPGQATASVRTSGPFAFVVAASTAPPETRLLRPADGATIARSSLVLSAHVTAPAEMTFYVSPSPAHAATGEPTGGISASCTRTANAEGDYDCDVGGSPLQAGNRYHWWVVVRVSDGVSVFGPSSFTVRADAPAGPAKSVAPKRVSDAPRLPVSNHFAGKSVRHDRLSKAAYDLSKLIGRPKSIAVGCWSGYDWPAVSGSGDDGYYVTLGFFMPAMPHWIQLSPYVCRSFETLLYHRPQYPNRYTANAVETLTHEMMHAVGVRDEARAECFGMQLSIVLASRLGVPAHYSRRLAHITLENYRTRPPSYRNYARCREDGAWDLWPGENSPPWHNFADV